MSPCRVGGDTTFVAAFAKLVKPQAIGKRLGEPNVAFDGDAPADLIPNGKIDLIWRMIFELRPGVSG